jgi:alpha-tubulin suppressor-like RCC1 family protein
MWYLIINLQLQGRNDDGQVGAGISGGPDGFRVYKPARVNQTGVLLGVNIVQIDIYAYHTLALSDTGNVYSWGKNENGMLCNSH